MMWPIAGGEVVCLFVGNAIFLVYESCEDVARAGINGFGEEGVEYVDGGIGPSPSRRG